MASDLKECRSNVLGAREGAITQACQWNIPGRLRQLPTPELLKLRDAMNPWRFFPERSRVAR